MKKFNLLMFGLLLAGSFAHAACELRADTTNNNFAIGPFVDPSTGDAETALTVLDGDILWKQPDSTTTAEELGFTDCTHRAAGMYTCPYDNTVVDVEGMAQYVVDVAGALTVFGNCMVLDAGFFDIKYGATSLLTSDDAGLLESTTIASVTSQILVVLTAGAINDGAYPIGASVYIKDVSSTEKCETTVASWDGDTLTLGLATACEDFTIAATDFVRVYAFGSARGQEVIDDNVVTASGAAIAASNALDGVVSGTCDSGTNATCVDAALTQADTDYFLGSKIVFLSGNAINQARCITAFTPASDTVAFAPVATQAIGADDYNIVADPVCERVATAQSDLDLMAGSDGTTLATAQGNYAPLLPTTAGRTLDIAATGEAGVDLSNVNGTLDASEVGADFITAAKVADSTIDAATFASGAINAAAIAVDAIGASELAADASTEIWAVQCEDQGSTYTCRELLSILLAEAAGTAVYTSGTRTWVVKDPSGTETRLTLLYGSELDGDRTTSTLAPMTP